jgi:ABC-2 type transport system ATP-binding protein
VTSSATGGAVRVRTTEADRLANLLAGDGRHIERIGPDVLQVTGIDSTVIGVIAAREAIALIELTPQLATLEEAFMEITRDAVEFHGSMNAPSGAELPRSTFAAGQR